jgi:hypothetical protein
MLETIAKFVAEYWRIPVEIGIPGDTGIAEPMPVSSM